MTPQQKIRFAAIARAVRPVVERVMAAGTEGACDGMTPCPFCAGGRLVVTHLGRGDHARQSVVKMDHSTPACPEYTEVDEAHEADRRAAAS